MTLIELRQTLRCMIEHSLKPVYFPNDPIPEFDLNVPTSTEHGDFSVNIALKCARILRKSPLMIAQEFCPVIMQALKASELADSIQAVEAVAPGFINFRLSHEAFYSVLYGVFERGRQYGCSEMGKGKKVQIEFVSSNPTGPLTIAHARQAAVGDVLANIMVCVGFDVQREYYVNDGGNQIVMLGKSIFLRAKEALGEAIDFPEDCYQGQYIKTMAQIFMDERGIRDAEALDAVPDNDFKQFGVAYLMNVIRQELDDFGVHFDVWSYESQVSHHAAIEKVLADLDQRGMLYQKDGALWFRSTDFGDDKDRVVKKSDGTYTYLAPDIAYHKNKYDRGFDKVYNIWGPDHHGYIPRIKAAVQALGHNVDALEVLIVQLATIYRNGQPVSMSTRKGEFISLREVLTEVGKDAARFFFLMRSISAHLDFDLDLAKKETPENPVYYIQYAHARICSIVEKAKESGLEKQLTELCLLTDDDEIALIRHIGMFQDVVEQCAFQMEPFALVLYLQELAACFHRFYDRHRVVDLSNNALSCERLSLIDAARIVLANGLRLLGVATPEKM